MRKANHIYYLAGLAAGILTGCSSEFLDRPPQSQIVDANFYQTAEQVLAGTAPLYNLVWFDYNDKASHGIGDARGGILTSGSYQLENIQMNTTGLTAENGASWRSFYNIVGQSNTLIKNIEQFAGENVPANIKQYAIAEARFMRGLAYSYLVQNWGPVPVIEDNSTLLQDTSIARNTIPSVWEFIMRDLRFAVQHMPETAPQEGRLTKWAAEGMLAKMFLARSGVGQSGSRNQADLDSAAWYAKHVIDNSGASLLPEYRDLFLMENNNNPESLFALQWVYNGGWGTNNSVQAYLAYGSEITGFGDGWGGDIGASLYILEKYEEADKRRKATFMLPASHYSYITQVPSGGEPQELRVPVNSTDEESRRYNSRVWVKKYVVGRPEDNDGKVQQQRTEINTYMLRLADVYLIYAEAVLGNNASTSDGEALQYYNAVRTRAGLDPKTSVTWEDIFNERLLEFAMEGQAWYEFTRLHYYDPQKAYTILSGQDRGFFRIYPDQIPDPNSWEIEIDEGSAQPRTYVVNAGNFYLPLPATELSRAPNLRKPPVPYDFGE
ncbi:putative outer membrane starch-binding protein [Anseongella ginsenosidimutans]|uniref:Putative outer membrane starch-binding protein n=2 Tax=Anseongella ginsenosidimutans TaxID=496056 RepID=A0A4R3KX04_9SPHI|nr:RagB/SusD family nutrient uptake outer membrane protein [Anseongella ginsenosidimutans]TCS89931.1 putative outer membrane starch-binding protein [Anseongella ginsenosidimutans]